MPRLRSKWWKKTKQLSCLILRITASAHRLCADIRQLMVISIKQNQATNSTYLLL